MADVHGLEMEAIDRIAELGAHEAKVEGKFVWSRLPNDTSRRVFFVRSSGAPVEYELQVPPLAVELKTIADFSKFVLDHTDDQHVPVVFYDESGLYAWLDGQRRTDCVRLSLQKTAACAALSQLVLEPGKKPTLHDQPEMLRFLRVDMDGARTDDKLLTWVKNCKWRSANETARTVGHGQDSMGTSVELAVVNPFDEGKGCPEEVTFRVRLWDEPSITEEHDIRCAVVLHLAQKKFEVTPFPGQLEKAVETELTALAKYLGDKEVFGERVPFYRGKPE